MYAAHAEKKRQEASQLELHKCISLLEKAVSDSDRFSAVLEITKHIRFNTFTSNDRERVVSAMGFEFLSKLITMTYLPKECPSNLYRSMALSMLSTICMEPSVVSHPHMKIFLKDINDVLLNSKPLDRDKTLSQMKADSLDILSQIVHHPNGDKLLAAYDTVDFLLKFVGDSSKDAEIAKALFIIGLMLKNQGDGIFQRNPDKLTPMMDFVSRRLSVGSDVREKIEYARVVTVILDSLTMVSIELNEPWVQRIAGSIGKLLLAKLPPEDSEVLFYMFVALFNHVGCDILNVEGQNTVTLVKVVVARVAVEVYMLLDGIGPSNASSRFPRLNKVYRLLSDIVQYVCGDFGEAADTDTIIALYRKFVDISNTVMEFLYSIEDQEVELPRNHSVVLISVRVLAAMLSEITEDPSPTLLKLLPFFNLLCQNVEYSDDVQLEVKNVTQAALENIKLMCLQPVEEERQEETFSSASNDINFASNDIDFVERSAKDEPIDTLDATDTSEPFSTQMSKRTEPVKNEAVPTQSHNHQLKEEIHSVKRAFYDVNRNNSDLKTSLFYVPGSKSGEKVDNNIIDLEANSCSDIAESNPLHELSDATDLSPSSTDICLSEENIEEFLTFQEETITEKAKKSVQMSRHRSIANQMKRKKNDVQSSEEDTAESDNWKVLPDDILGFLLPAYLFLLNHKEAVKVMADCDAFQTIVDFLEQSTTETLKGKSSSLPESTTINALQVIQQLFTENPDTASTLLCLLDFFEISILSVPNLVNIPNPPPMTCLKIIEVSLVALKFYKRSRKRNSSLHRIKHSRSRFFKSVIDYLLLFYDIRQHRTQGLTLHITSEHKDVWPVASDYWCGCLEGLCSLVNPMEDLQEMLVKTPMLSQFMTFLAHCKMFNIESAPEPKRKIIESYFDLIQTAAEASNALRGFVLHSQGVLIARKFNLKKLEQILDLHKGKEYD